ncbi:MAG: hypothetical protein RJQ09_07025 [Cyclobacteriaceae bacterium]
MKIGILIHQNDRRFIQSDYVINHQVKWWNRKYSIEIIRGLKHRPVVDLLINHVDLTIMPDEYLDFMSSYELVLNRNVVDISKKKISANLVSQNSDYEGKVLVKPDLNDLGFPEYEMKSRITRLVLKPIHYLTKSFDEKSQFKIYDSIGDVPDKYFSNSKYVVEKYLPEYKDGLYYLRSFRFFGDRCLCSTLGSKSQIIKGRNTVIRDDCTPPPEIFEYQKKFDFDFGKFDFTIYNGSVILLDANKTPGYYSALDDETSKYLAEGLDSYL